MQATALSTKAQKDIASYTTQVATLSGASDATRAFNVDPSIQQRMIGKLQEISSFLRRINMDIVEHMEGEKIHVGTSSITTRTKNNERRQVIDPSDMTADIYKVIREEANLGFSYDKLNSWAGRSNFQGIMRSKSLEQQGRDMLTIGFNGTSIAESSDRVANPLLQDVNKGWLQKTREKSTERVLSDIKIGDQAGADYKNLDAAVYDATNELIDDVYQEGGDLVVICGRSLVTDKYLGLIQENEKPTENAALNMLMSNQQIGTIPIIRVPFFPRNAMLITALSNLSIYTQRGTQTRFFKDEVEYNRIVEYNTAYRDYVVEEYAKIALIENIKTPDSSGGWK